MHSKYLTNLFNELDGLCDEVGPPGRVGKHRGVLVGPEVEIYIKVETKKYGI